MDLQGVLHHLDEIPRNQPENTVRKSVGKIVARYNQIFSEYQRHMSWNTPGAGYAFLLWVHDNRYNPAKCDQIHIRPDPGCARTFLEFPNDPDLQGFDPDDQKFVAVALSHPDCPPVLNAVDTDWWYFKSELERHGVRLEFLCGDDLRRLAERRERDGP